MKTFLGIIIFSIICMAFTISCTQQPTDIHENAITLDTHVDISNNYATETVDPGIDNPRLRCDLTKMENGGMDGVFLAAYVGNRDDLSAEASQKAHESVMNKITAIHRLAEQMYPDRCELAVTPDDVGTPGIERTRGGCSGLLSCVRYGRVDGTEL